MKRTITFAISLYISLIICSQNAIAPTLGDGTVANPFQIATLENLYWLSQVSSVWNMSFIQTSDIDASSTFAWDNGYGFTPIGNESSRFTGIYNGQNHTITSLTIKKTTDNIGLFGYLGSTGTIKNIGMISSSITGSNKIGGIVGFSQGIIFNCYNTGTVTGNGYIGGIVGVSYNTLSNSYNTGLIIGSNSVGGLVGENNSDIFNCYNTGTVKGSYSIGGLVGYNGPNTMSNCYSVGAVGYSTANGIGALVGSSYNSIINNCYWNQNIYANGIGLNSYVISNNCVGKTTVDMQSTYFVQLLNANRGIYSSWILVTGGYPTFGSNGTSIDNNKIASLNIYPNPAIDRLHITGLYTDASVSIFDISGKTSLSYQHVKDAIININSLAKGIYILKITTDEGVITRRLVKE